MINKEDIKKFWEEHKSEIKEGGMKALKYGLICGGVALIFKGGFIVGQNKAADIMQDFSDRLVKAHPEAKVADLYDSEQFMTWYREIYDIQ